MGSCLSAPSHDRYQSSSDQSSNTQEQANSSGTQERSKSHHLGVNDAGTSSGASSGPTLKPNPRGSTEQAQQRNRLSSVSKSSLLIELASGLGDENRAALAQFHVASHGGLHNLQTESELLKDLHLTEKLGTGGFACVLRGFWRGSTEVAVKCFVTRPSGASGDNSGDNPPAKALTEALLARDLAHPNIIRTFDVRCCRMSRTFLEATKASNAVVMNRSQSVQDLIANFQGNTPLWPVACKPTPEEDKDVDDIMQSGDGFGAVNRGSHQPPLAWSELLLCLGGVMKEGDYITIIIMGHASFGTLGSAIKKHVFSSQSASPSDRRRRFRALLRTAREIAMALEHLHDCGIIHADLKPANVLLQDSRADTRGFTALVSDFGLSHLLASGSNLHFSQNAHGTTSYLAPELLMEGAVHRGVDIYAFGILLYEMVMGHPAWAPELRQTQVLMAVMAGQRPVLDTLSTDPGFIQLKDLYRRCVAQDPEARPNAKQLVEELTRLEEDAHRAAVRSSREEQRASLEAHNRQSEERAAASLQHQNSTVSDMQRQWQVRQQQEAQQQQAQQAQAQQQWKQQQMRQSQQRVQQQRQATHPEISVDLGVKAMAQHQQPATGNLQRAATDVSGNSEASGQCIGNAGLEKSFTQGH